MKSRYQGICTLSLFFLVLSLVGAYYFSGTWQQDPVRTQPRQIPPGDVKVPSAAQLKTMHELLPRLPAMALPRPRNASAVSMALFGQSNTGTAGGHGDNQAIADARAGQHLLSVTVLAGAVRFCILDGTFLAEGALLPGGAILRRIENKRVQIVRQGQATWVPLKEDMANTLPAADDLQKGQT